MADSNYIIAKLQENGVLPGDASILAAVGFAESSYRTGIIGDQQYGGSVGIFQINIPAHAGELRQWTGSSKTDDWINWLSGLDNNIYAAAQVYKSQGLGAWTMYFNGGYKQYLGKNYIVNNTGGGSSGSISGGGTVGGGTAGESSLTVPETQYGIVPDSTWTSLDVLWGRRYRVIVSSLDGETALDVSQLRVTFNCAKTMQLEPQFSEIVIYNLSPKSENLIIQEGFRITVEAGYEGSQYGLIFDGTVVQPIRNKEDGTTYTLTLVAADADRWMSYSISNFSMVRGQNSRNVVDGLASKATIPSELGNISDSLSTSKLTRGKVIFGLTRDYIRQIALSENATSYIEGGKINIVKADDIPEGEILDISSESGLIGVPTQSDYGVTIRCLLNPRIKCNMLVHVDNSLVRAQQFEQGQQVYALDQDGIYKVIQITIIGDTRGNDWYTEIETVTQAGKLPAMIANGTQSSL